jgi:pimeloyl-ACP methyl ester carboxylesterase
MIVPFLHNIVRRRLLRQGVQSKTLRLGHGVLHYYEIAPPASTTTLILVHGLGTSASTWVHVLPTLGRNMRVLAPDLPGFGLSSPLPGVPKLEDYVTSLEEFMDSLVKGSCIVLGHSMGGWITMKLALANRGRISHLVLMNTAGIYYRGVDELRELFSLHSSKDTRKLLDRIWVRYPWYFRPFTPFIYEDLVQRKVPEIVRNVQERDFMNADLARLTMKVSVIWGGRDGLIARETLQVLDEKLPARRLYMIEESGHVPQLQTPEKLLETLDAVFKESAV